MVPDFRKSRKLYEIARSRGCADAINSLAWLYHHGLGVSQNFLKARELYEEASGQGDIDGMFNLALLYKHDLSSGKFACEWMAKAKDAGDGQAASKLAEWHC